MLHLLLSPADGGTAWRHLLAEGEARAGFEPVGPLGLARRLGRVMGIPAEMASAPERLGPYWRRLDAHDDGTRSYSESRGRDPAGVARYLLGLRDHLRLLGWDGRALDGSARLADLSALEAIEPTVPPGFPDVVTELVREIRAAGALPFPIRLELRAPRGAFEPLVRNLLDALAAAGATLTDPAPDAPLARDGSDLGLVQRALLDPSAPSAELRGDGTFLVLEADTPLEAAELTASLARTRPLADATFVVACEPDALDAALARQGLPTLGASAPSRLRPHLQVLPLRLALAFSPQDPFRAAELLLLPGGPLPGHARRALLDALNEMPGIGSPAWTLAVDECVARESAVAAERGENAAAAKASGASLRERIAGWFGGDLHDPAEGIPAAKAAALCAWVARWAGGRMKGASDDASGESGSGAAADSALWAHAAAVARALERLLLARPPVAKLPEQALMQLHGIAAGSGSELAAFDAESGRPAIVAHPAALTTHCPEVVWWGFVQGADLGPAAEPWTFAEREALLRAGVALPDPGDRRGIEAAGWRRPILAARERAALVRWRLAGTEPAPPHALLDELSTRLAAGALAACTVASERLLASRGAAAWKASTAAVAPAAPMAQRPAWKVPAAAVAPSFAVSWSSLESFIGCPFRWALRYKANLLPGGGVSLPEGKVLLGDFAHRILQDMLCGRERLALSRARPEDARAWAEKAFDARVGVEAAPLVRRGAEVELDRARTLVSGAAASLLDLLKRTGWKPVDAERAVTGTFAGLPARGYVDLVVEKDGVEGLVDLKLSGLLYRLEELESGHALQLALYASLLRKSARALPPSGFFVLDDGQLLTTDGKAFPGATVVEGPGSKETLKGSEEAFRYWKKVLAAGVLPSLREELAWEDAVAKVAGPPPEEGSLARRPTPCRYCDYGGICKPSAARPDEAEA